MQTTRCIFTAATALRTVFVTGPVDRRKPISQLQKLLSPAFVASQQTRSVASGFRRLKPNNGSPNAQDNKAKTAKNRGFPRDREIPYPIVQVRNEDGSLSEPTATEKVLGQLNPSEHSLVVKALPGNTGTGGVRYPVCVIVNKHEEFEAEMRKAKEAKEKAKAEKRLLAGKKELELNWAIAAHDLDYKLKQLREFLLKGRRVDVMLLNKKRKRKATKEEARETLDKVKEVAKGISGVSEYKSQEGNVGATMRIYYEGPAYSAQAAADAETEAELADGAQS